MNITEESHSGAEVKPQVVPRIDLIIDTVGFSLVIFLLVPSDFSSTALPLLPPFGIIEYFFSILV